MDFSPGLPEQAYTRITFSLLRELLRLPKHIEIVGVRPDPADPRRCLLDLAGLIPAGELAVDYSYEHTTIVRFGGLRQV